MMNYPKYKVAAVQAGPVYMDLDATVTKACKLIEEAASNGAKLVGFPESFLSGYPWWIWLGSGESCEECYPLLLASAVTDGDGTLARIGECAKENNIYVCISGHERVGDCVHMTQFWFNDQGDLIGKHRKMKATAAERRVWTDGDGSTMRVMNTAIGKLGSLQCAEHHVPAYRATLGAQGQQIHVAGYPPLPVQLPGTMGAYGPFNAVKTLCIENKAFGIMCCQVISQECLDMVCGDDLAKLNKMPTMAAGHGGVGGGFARIVNPRGEDISDRHIPDDEEGIVYGDVDLNDCVIGKMYYDCYVNAKRASFMHLELDVKSEQSLIIKGEAPDNFVQFSDLKATK